MFSFNDTEIRSITAAGTLARELLLSTFIEQGAEYGAAEARIDKLLDEFISAGERLEALPADEQSAFAAELARILDQLQKNTGTAEAAARAIRAAKNVPLGWGKETQRAALGIGLALTLFAKVVGTGFDYTPQNGLSVSSPAGLAPGIEQSISDIAGVVGEALKTLGEDAGKAGKALPEKREASPKPRVDKASRTDLVPSAAKQRVITQANGDAYLTDRRDAEEVALILREGLGEKYDLPYRNKEDAADLYWRRNQKIIEWEREHSYSLDTGIVPVKLKDQSWAYRVMVQIQTPTNVKAAPINDLKKRLNTLSHGLVVLRTVTREVMLLNGDVSPSWRRLAPGLGGPLALHDSVKGTAGLFVRTSDETAAYLLTAGHVLSGFGTANPLGQDVFSPPMGGDYGGDTRIGTVSHHSEFTRSCRDQGVSTDVDIGVIKLDLGVVPGSERRLSVDGYSLRQEVAEVDETLFGTALYKGPSKTRRAKATLRALGVSVEMTNPATMRCVRGDGLILATLDRQAPAEGGESGCLVYDALNRPLGLVVAGSDAMPVTDAKGATARPAIYIQPLADYLRTNGWSPF